MVNADTDSLAKTKIGQLSKNDSNQIYTKHVKNHDIINRFMIYDQNITVLKINEFMLSLPATAPHPICVTEHH
jgi:hypothetical protein